MSKKTIHRIIIALFVCILILLAYDFGGSSVIRHYQEIRCRKLGYDKTTISWEKYWFWKHDITVTCSTTTIDELELK